MKKHCYFLIYRHRLTSKQIRWDRPTGGLVTEPDRIVAGIPISDMALAAEVLEQRYHCGPHEETIICEVFGREEKRLARKLHRQWETSMREFVELMNLT